MSLSYVPAPDYEEICRDEAKLSVLRLFRMGHGTDVIAKIKGMDEYRVYNFLAQAREKERGQIEQLRGIK